MSTLTDNPAFNANEIYQIASTDNVEGAAIGASNGGLGIANLQAQKLANRTALLYNRQQTNIANIATLLTWMARFQASLVPNGAWIKVPFGAVTLLVQMGYCQLNGTQLSHDTQYTVTWPIAFPNQILIPPIATNYYVQSRGSSIAASVVSYNLTQGVFVLDLPSILKTEGQAGPETTNGFAWVAFGL